MTLELILGPMFCGKTEELIRRVEREKVVDKEVIAFKPSIDTRYSKHYIKSHTGAKIHAIPINKSSKIRWHLKRNPKAKIIALDEIQFFDKGIVKFCIEYANRHDKEVIASGLPLDFRREAFDNLREIMPYAHITILRAKCTYRMENNEICDKGADYSQRLVDGKPAHYNDPLIKVGASESYAARCLKHHFVPGKDNLHAHYWKD